MYETQPETQLLAEFYDAQPQAILWMKPLSDAAGEVIDFVYAYANEAGLRYFNGTRAQLIGRLLSQLPLPGETAAQALAETVSVHRAGSVRGSDVLHPTLERYVHVIRTPLRGGVLVTVQQDAQQPMLDKVLQNSSNGISVSKIFRDENGTVIDALTIMANDAAVKYIGFPKDIYLSKKATEIEPDVIGSPYYQMCIRTLETGEPFVTQYLMGSTGRWLELTVSRLDNDHLIQIFTDCTSVRQSQQQLEQTIKALERSNASLADFAHAASHDMKEPLRKVLTFIDRLKSTLGARMSENETTLFSRIEVAAERMQLLVDDLLEFSHVSEKPREMEMVDLNEKVQKVLSDLELSIEEKGAKVIVDPLPTIRGNKRQLQQLFQNLVSNALKYSKPDVQPQITINARLLHGSEAPVPLLPAHQDIDFHLIEISDNGIGFEQQYAGRIFEMFQRLHGRAEYSGTGVGLSIARKVVENHNGYIWAEGRPGEGASFKILFPAAPQEA